MNETPLISIIATSYNNETYIGTCIESVINQKYQNWELWIMDDSSTDGTMEIISKYEELDSRVHGYSNEHGGMSVNRHRGMQYVKGEWVTFIDGDDIISPQMLDIMAKELHQQDIDIVSIKGKDFKSNQKLCSQFNENETKIWSSNGWDYWENVIKNPAFFGVGCSAFWGKIYRKSLFESERISKWLNYAKSMMPNTYFDDLAMMPRLYYEARTAVLIDEVAYFHRVSCGGISEILAVKTHNYEQMKAMKDKLDFYLEIKADEIANIESVAVFLNCLSTWYKGQLIAKSTDEFMQYEVDLRKLYNEYYKLVKQDRVHGLMNGVKIVIIAFWIVSPTLWEKIMGKLYYNRKYHYSSNQNSSNR